MRNKSGDKARLQHILAAMLETETYLLNTNFSNFAENSMMRFACIKQLEIIGEALNSEDADVIKGELASGQID